MHLNELPLHQSAVIDKIEECDNQIRMQDLGFISGVKVECLLESSFKNPRMYRLLGTSVALRNEDAKYVLLRCEKV